MLRIQNQEVVHRVPIRTYALNPLLKPPRKGLCALIPEDETALTNPRLPGPSEHLTELPLGNLVRS